MKTPYTKPPSRFITLARVASVAGRSLRRLARPVLIGGKLCRYEMAGSGIISWHPSLAGVALELGVRRSTYNQNQREDLAS